MSEITRLVSRGIDLELAEQRAAEQREQERERKLAEEEAALRERALAAVREKFGSLWDELEPYATFDAMIQRGFATFSVKHPMLIAFDVHFHNGDMCLMAPGITRNHLDEDSIARFILECYRERERQEKTRQVCLAVAADVIEVAASYVQSFDAAVAEIKAWAEAETARLWRPWSAWEVRYVPMFIAPDSLSEEAISAFVETVVATDLPRGSLKTVTAIDKFTGNTRKIVIGAFYDARGIDFEESSVKSALDYHAVYIKSPHKASFSHYRFDVDVNGPGTFVVNVPPMVNDQPRPCDVTVDRWADVVARASDDRRAYWLLDRIANMDTHEVANMTPEQLVG